MLSFCVFKDQLHMASKNQSKIVTLKRDDEIAEHFWDEKPDVVITLGGPYPFTKLRIILATAQGFSAGHGVEYHFIKTFDFLNMISPGSLFALETRRGDYFAFQETLGEVIMTKEQVDQSNYPLVTDDSSWGDINLAEKMIEFYPHLTTSKNPHYFYTPEYKKSAITSV